MKKHIYISGRVQGVGFRHFTRKNAQRLGIKGWVKNLRDGRVEAVFEGSEEKVKEMIDHCRSGPVSAYVKDLREEQADGEEIFNGFEVRY